MLSKSLGFPQPLSSTVKAALPHLRHSPPTLAPSDRLLSQTQGYMPSSSIFSSHRAPHSQIPCPPLTGLQSLCDPEQ